jgi:hypothetical protein
LQVDYNQVINLHFKRRIELNAKFMLLTRKSLIATVLSLISMSALLGANAVAQTPVQLPVSGFTSITQWTLASGINDSGVICGATQQTRTNPASGKIPGGSVAFYHAARWTPASGSYSFLDIGQLKPDGNNAGRWVGSWANSINNSGQIVGNSTNGGTGSSIHVNSAPGFFWQGSGPMTTLAEDTTTHFTWAYSVDNNGKVYGARETVIGLLENDGFHTGVFWANSSPLSVAFLQNLPSNSSTERYAEALGSNGTLIVGHATQDYWTVPTQAVYWPTTGAAPVSVGKPVGLPGTYSHLVAVKQATVNSVTHDIAVGYTTNGNAYLSANDPAYHSGGAGSYAYDITTASFISLTPPSGAYGYGTALSINASGVIVGSAYRQDPDLAIREYACKWVPTSMGVYTASWLPAGGLSRLTRATGINSSGKIVGIGIVLVSIPNPYYPYGPPITVEVPRGFSL